MTQTSFLTGTDLFTARARRTDPATSHKAAESTNVARSQRLVLAWLGNYGAATSETVVDALALSPSRCRGALNELQKRGLVRVVSERGVTKLGHPCRVYEVVR